MGWLLVGVVITIKRTINDEPEIAALAAVMDASAALWQRRCSILHILPCPSGAEWAWGNLHSECEHNAAFYL